MTIQMPTRPSVTGTTAVLDGHLAGTGRPRPPLRYLRRKPGRGLVAVFGPGEAGDLYTVSVDERALADDPASGGATIARFPEDRKLPHLPAVMAPMAHPVLAGALESAARRISTVPAGRPLRDAIAETVRYKPGDRCVLRYRLRFGDADEARTVSLVAKLYREPGEAQAAQDLLVRLRDGAGLGWTARPLGVVPGLPLALTEDLGGRHDAVPARSGLDVVRPRSAEASEVITRAARALAELHTSGLGTGQPATRTAADEAAKAARRGGLLEQYVPGSAPQVRTSVGALCAALEALPRDTVRPAHGSYKSSQLLVREGAVFLVDFDQFCLADPALDVGYFLAYLRPAGLWYSRAGRREWFEAAAAAFLDAYLARLTERGEPASTGAGVAARAHVFEAALLLKIAARRANRMHSPRPGEVAAILAEVSRCLARAEGAAPTR